MKCLYTILIAVLLQSPIWARWAQIPLKKAVNKSDLIIIGTLKDVNDHSENKMDYGSGIINIDEIIYGKRPGNNKKITLIWQNPSNRTCPRIEHKHEENRKGIWLLKLQKDGKVKADHPMRFLPLDKKVEVEKLLSEITLKPTQKETDNTEELRGISEVKINKDGSVILIDAKNGMWFPDSQGGFKPSVKLKKGESCDFIDGDHAFMKYRFDKIENGKITFTVTDKFDARSFGHEIKTSTKKITIKPY